MQGLFTPAVPNTIIELRQDRWGTGAEKSLTISDCDYLELSHRCWPWLHHGREKEAWLCSKLD